MKVVTYMKLKPSVKTAVIMITGLMVTLRVVARLKVSVRNTVLIKG